jgi:hypothetical protein
MVYTFAVGLHLGSNVNGVTLPVINRITKRQYLGILEPTIPATKGPLLIPILILILISGFFSNRNSSTTERICSAIVTIS